MYSFDYICEQCGGNYWRLTVNQTIITATCVCGNQRSTVYKNEPIIHILSEFINTHNQMATYISESCTLKNVFTAMEGLLKQFESIGLVSKDNGYWELSFKEKPLEEIM